MVSRFATASIHLTTIFVMRTKIVSTKRYCRLSTIHTRRVR